MIDVAIVGASGYGGGELLRWLANHPRVRIASATSNTYAGKPVSVAFPGMAGRINIEFANGSNMDSVKQCPLVFLARDNGVAMKMVPELLAAGCKVIDLSADFRFRNPKIYDAWYKGPHTSPELSRTAVYGLPELHREEIKTASVVGNPGCYTTTCILALAPLFANPSALFIDPSSIIIDALSGVSGAGRSKFGLDYHFAEVNESASAYKIAGTHRHTPEIEQELSLLANRPVALTFTPHLVPMTRGILATCHANLAADTTTTKLIEHYKKFYADEPFVFVSEGLPSTKHTVGSNMCHIGLAVDERLHRATVVSTTDNLGKGMVGQAIQNMNLMFSFGETAGLNTAGLWP